MWDVIAGAVYLLTIFLMPYLSIWPRALEAEGLLDAPLKWPQGPIAYCTGKAKARPVRSVLLLAVPSGALAQWMSPLRTGRLQEAMREVVRRGSDSLACVEAITMPGTLGPEGGAGHAGRPCPCRTASLRAGRFQNEPL